MELNEVMKHLEKNIATLEKQVYNFETVSIPRFEADQKILAKMRNDFIKMDALKQKKERGEPITNEEIYDSIPSSFR